MIPERPRWLDDEAEVRALFAAALDRFDRQPGDDRRRDLTLPLAGYLPSLARQDETADQLWHLLGALEPHGWLRRRPARRRNPLDPPYLEARVAFRPEAEAVLRAWLDRPHQTPALAAWREAVQAHRTRFPGNVERLLARPLEVPGRRPDEMVAALAGAATERGPVTLRQLSARLLWGDSKRLDGREDLIAGLFPGLDLQPRALVVNVRLGTGAGGVLFVENQESYVTLAERPFAAADDFTLVYTAGFRGSAQRIRESAGVCLHYAEAGGDRDGFEAWWFGRAGAPGPLHFFGDLDLAGMAILAALRERFGAVDAWRPGYDRLLARLHQGAGHPLAAADKSGQTDPGRTGCPYADDVLLPAIRALGCVDQEAV